MKIRKILLPLFALVLTAAILSAPLLPALAADKGDAAEEAQKTEETAALLPVCPAESFEIEVNGKTLDAKALVMVPARAVAEALGFDVIWNKNGTFTLDDGVMKTTVTLGKDSCRIEPSKAGVRGASDVSLGIAPYCVEGVSYVPLGLFEALKGNMEGMFRFENGKIVIECEESAPSPILGGWTRPESPVVTDEIRALLEKATEGLVGARYVPAAYLGSQLVAGKNHAILCRVAPVVPDAKESWAIITVYEDLQGNVTLTEVKNSGISTGVSNEQLPGGWSYTSPELGESALGKSMTELFDLAFENETGEAYTPLALLKSQVVAGVNYCFLCQSQSGYALVTIFAALDGHAEVLEIESFGN